MMVKLYDKYNNLSTEKLIVKTLFDKLGVTEFLGGNITAKKVDIIPTLKESDYNKLVAKLDALEKDPVQVDLYLKAHGLEQVEGLKDYILNNEIKQNSVNELITQQNFKNIADQASGFKGVNTAIKEYNKLTDTASKSKLAETISTTNTSLGKYLTGLNGAKASLGSYAGSLVTATAKTIALEAATMAMNAAISMGISFLVSTAISAIVSWADNVIHAAEKAKEAAEEAKSAIDDIKSDFDSLSSTTNDIKERFAELAQEVENLGKVNQSRGTLSADDYDEFLDLSNQLAELFPQLTKNYDENGNAILNLSGNVDTIVGSLNDLVLVQQKIANQQILEEMPDVWAGYTTNLEEYTEELEDAEAQASSYQTALEKLSVSGDGKITVTDSALHQSLLAAAKKIGLDEGKWYQDNLSSFYNETWDYSGAGAGASEFKSAEWDFSSLTKAQIDQLKNALAALGSEYEKAVKSSKNKIDSANSDMTDYIGTWLSGEWNYAQMDADMQNVARDVLFNTDWVSQLPDDVDASDWDDVSSWLQENFLYAINEIDNAEIQTALVDAFNGSLSIEDLQYLISQLTRVEGFDQKNPLIIYLKTKQTDAKTLQKQIDDVIQFTKDKFDGYDPTTFFEENSIDTQEEVDKWLEIAKSANSAADAEKKYLESLESDAASNVKQSIADKWNSLIDTDDEELKNTREDLLALAKAGQLTEETFYDTTGADTFLKSINENISETIKWINQLVSSSTQLESMSAQISKMSDMLADKKNGTTASASDLAGFDATVKGLESWEEFERTLGSSKSTMEECQAAANKLATEWVNNGIFLGNLTEENKQYYITQLANMGIENATAIVTETLTARKIAEKYAINDLTNATIDEIKVKYQEIAALVEEGKVSETTASALYDLIYQQTIFSNQKLDVYGKISALQELALAFGVTADAALGASQAINLENQLRLAKHYGATDAQVDAYAGQLTSKMQDAIKAQFGGISTTISSSGSGDYKTSNSGGGSGSSAKSETKELFDWIEKRIDKLKSRYDKWLNQAGRAVNTTRIATYYKLAQKNLEKLLNTEAKAYKYYKKKAESVGLSEKYASKVRNGTLNIETITDEKLIDKINDYQQWYEKMVEMSESFISDTETLYNIPLDKAADKIEKFSDAIDLLDKKIDNAIGYKDKNKLLTREARNEKRIYKSYVAAQKATQKNLDTAGADLTLTKTLKNSGLTAKEKSAVKKAVKKASCIL